MKIISDRCKYGVMHWLENDLIIGRSLELYGEFAEGENRILSRYVSPGSTVVDVGANLGTCTLALAKMVGPSGRVLSFEPQPLISQLLCSSVTINGLTNVRVLPYAVSDQRVWMHMEEPDPTADQNFGAAMLGVTGRPTPAVQLDAFVLGRCDLIKIDAEGHEANVLKGAELTLQRARPVVYFEAKKTTGTAVCIDWLLKHGWQCFWHFAFFYQNGNFKQNQVNVFGHSGDMNIVAIPRGKETPRDLPQIKSPDDDWEKVYPSFFKANGLKLW